MHYYVNDAGGWLTVSGDTDVFPVVPAGYREVTEAEFNEASGAIILPPPEDPPAVDEEP